jgi:hypothetical protein
MSALRGGACPQRLDHFQITTPRVPDAMRFYMDMGFRLSEYITQDGSDVPSFAFLQRKGNPHDVVFAHGPGPRLHHVAFTVPESYHLLFLCDRLAECDLGDNVESDRTGTTAPAMHASSTYATPMATASNSSPRTIKPSTPRTNRSSSRSRNCSTAAGAPRRRSHG